MNTHFGIEKRPIMVFERVRTEKGIIRAQKGPATFLCFGVNFEEIGLNVGQFSIAIIEWPNGRCDAIWLDLIDFLDSDRDANATAGLSDREREIASIAFERGYELGHENTVATGSGYKEENTAERISEAERDGLFDAVRGSGG